MDMHGDELAQAAKMQLRLPRHLRTEHWYNDWQHAVFIITFEHLMRALANGQQVVAERLVDKLTVYLFVHFLCEEEGMSWAVAKGIMRAEALRAHQIIHLRELETWHRTVQAPFKAGDLREQRLAIKVRDFYEGILGHIDDMDQPCYGAKADRDEPARLEEIAHLAQCGLPLSPNMAGAAAVVGACNAPIHALLKRPMLPLQAKSPLRPLSLVTLPGDMAADTLRARFLRTVRALPAALNRAA